MNVENEGGEKKGGNEKKEGPGEIVVAKPGVKRTAELSQSPV